MIFSASFCYIIPFFSQPLLQRQGELSRVFRHFRVSSLWTPGALPETASQRCLDTFHVMAFCMSILSIDWEWRLHKFSTLSFLTCRVHQELQACNFQDVRKKKTDSDIQSLTTITWTMQLAFLPGINHDG